MKYITATAIVFLALAIMFGGVRSNQGELVDTNAIEPVLEVNYNRGW